MAADVTSDRCCAPMSETPNLHTRYIPGEATPDSVVEADEAIRLDLGARAEAAKVQPKNV